MNLAGDRVDDIPNRGVLRQLIEALEKRAGATPLPAKRPVPEDVKVLGAARADMVREAQRVGKLRNMKVADVVDRAAKGAFRFTDLQRLTLDDLPVLRAAVEILRQVT
jgi:hypothetical protein